VLRGGPADNSIGLDRTNGMLSEVKKSSIQVEMAPNFGGWSSDGGSKLMENMLARFKKIDAVFSENDSMGLGAQKAIADAGRSKEIFIVGVDDEKAALENIMKPGSNCAATDPNNSDQTGRVAFHRMMAVLAGAKAPPRTFPCTISPIPCSMPANPISAPNVDTVILDAFLMPLPPGSSPICCLASAKQVAPPNDKLML
jgi:ribose transport system substrate-binding protein